MSNNRQIRENMPKYYTVKEVAEIMKVSEKTVRNWIKWGRIKAIKIGRQWRIPAEEIDNLK